jgi:hypothetical protein
MDASKPKRQLLQHQNSVKLYKDDQGANHLALGANHVVGEITGRSASKGSTPPSPKKKIDSRSLQHRNSFAMYKEDDNHLALGAQHAVGPLLDRSTDSISGKDAAANSEPVALSSVHGSVERVANSESHHASFAAIPDSIRILNCSWGEADDATLDSCVPRGGVGSEGNTPFDVITVSLQHVAPEHADATLAKLTAHVGGTDLYQAVSVGSLAAFILSTHQPMKIAKQSGQSSSSALAFELYGTRLCWIGAHIREGSAGESNTRLQDALRSTEGLSKQGVDACHSCHHVFLLDGSQAPSDVPSGWQEQLSSGSAGSSSILWHSLPALADKLDKLSCDSFTGAFELELVDMWVAVVPAENAPTLRFDSVSFKACASKRFDSPSAEAEAAVYLEFSSTTAGLLTCGTGKQPASAPSAGAAGQELRWDSGQLPVLTVAVREPEVLRHAHMSVALVRGSERIGLASIALGRFVDANGDASDPVEFASDVAAYGELVGTLAGTVQLRYQTFVGAPGSGTKPNPASCCTVS